MPAIAAFALWALASTVLATPYAHGHGHGHVHKRQSATSGHAQSTGAPAAPYAYPHRNSTAVGGSTGIHHVSSSSTTPTSGSSSSAGPGTSDATIVRTHTSHATVTVTVKQNYASSAGAGTHETAVPGEDCTVVTVTSIQKVTQYVTEGAVAPSSAPVYSNALSSSTEASPIKSSAAASAPSAPAYSAPTSAASSTQLASLPPVYSSTSDSAVSPAKVSSALPPSVPASRASSSSKATPYLPLTSSPIPVSSTSSPIPVSSSPAATVPDAAPSSSTTSASSSAFKPSPTPPTSASGKRGLAYNDASLLTCFNGAREISWAYNWGSSSGGLKGDLTFVPTLWGSREEFTGPWSENAKSAIADGSTHLFSFNEPDHTDQANMSPAAAAAAYKTYMQPFQGQAQLCAPSVTNGGGAMGLGWLKSFLESCSDCQIDCINVHWYDSAENTAYFKSHVEEAITLANGKPVFVSEFGASGSSEQITTFLEDVMPWMDKNSNIAGYAYFMAKDGVLVTGSEPSTYGNTYMKYTS